MFPRTRPGRRREARGSGFLVPTVAVVLLLGSLSAPGQDAGTLRTSAEVYRDTLPGESVNGLALDFRQLLPIGGLLSAEVTLVDKTDQAALGRGALHLTDLAVAGARVTTEAGDLALKLDASAFHFANDFLPVAYLRGGAVRAEKGPVSVSLFQGRNEQFRGIRLPTVTFAPEYLTGATASLRLSESVTLDADALRTTNRQRASNPLFGVQIPQQAESYGAGGTVKLASFWIAQARASFASYTYAPGSLYASGHFLSYVAGTVVDTDRWKAQADYIREGVNYVPLSTASVGNREGPHILLQSNGERLTATASFASYRNNLESNPDVPDLQSRSMFASLGYRLTSSVFAMMTLSQQNLSSDRGGEISRFVQRTASSEIGFPTYGHTRLRYQYQTTDEPSLRQRLHEVEIEQQPPAILGVQALLGVRVQHADSGASSLLYRGGLNGSIRDIHLSVQGEWGRDLGASNVFALNRNQNITASLSVPLVAAVELRVEGYWNRISAVVNPESIFVSQATQEQLFSINRRSLLVRLVRAFQWGKQPATGQGLPGGDRIPYGLVEGFVFQDVNGNGVPDFGEPPAPGIFIRLDDGQTARSDANGHFAFSNVIEGSHNVGLDLEVLPASYNSPGTTTASVRVQRLAPGRHDFGLIPTGSLSGTVEQFLSSGKRVGFARAVVTLLPNDFSVYTDTDGRYHFSNLPPGRYWVRLEEASLPEGAVVEAGQSEEQGLRAGEEGSVTTLDFSLRIEEKPVQKIFEHEQTLPQKPSTPKRTHGDRQDRSR